MKHSLKDLTFSQASHKNTLNYYRLIVPGLCICLSALLFFTVPANAQVEDGQQIQSFKVRPLLEGYFKENGWSTIEVEITNGATPLQGELRSSFPVVLNTINTEYSYVTPVELAPNQTERFLQYVQPSSRNNNQVTIVLRNKAGKQLAQNSLRMGQLTSTDFLLGVLNDDSPSTEPPRVGFTSIKGSSTGIRLIYLTTRELSDRKELLDPLQGLLVADIGPNSITPQKRRAILAWVASGGQLYINGGNNLGARLSALGIDAALLPATTNGNVTVDKLSFVTSTDTSLDFPNKDKVNFSRLLPASDAFIAVRQSKKSPEPDSPLIVSKTLGQGAIVISALDLMAPQVTGWNRLSFVWTNMVIAADPNFTNTRSAQVFFAQDNIGRAMINSPGPDLPDDFTMLFVLLGYTLVLGPLSFVTLQRFKATNWNWITAPVIILFGTGAVLIASTLAPVGYVHLNRVSLIESFSDDLPASVKSYMITSSASSTPYRLSLDGSTTLLRPQPLALSSQVYFLPPQQLEQGTGTNAISSDDVSGLLQTFASEGYTDLKLSLDSNLSASQDSIDGTIVNHGNYKISQVVLLYGDNYYSIGDVNPGEEKKINFKLTRRPTLVPRPNIDQNIYVPPDFASSTSLNNGTPTNPWYSTGSPATKVATLRWSMLNASYQAGRFLPDDKTQALYFTGWLDDSELLGTAQVEGQKVVQQDSALVVRQMPVTFIKKDNPAIENQVTIPPSSLLVDKLTTDSSSSNFILVNQIPSGVQFQLPSNLIYPHLQVSKFSLYINSIREKDRGSLQPSGQPQNGWREPVPAGNFQRMPKVEIYNWQTTSWFEVVSAGDTRDRIDLTMPNINDYIDPNIGILRFRFTGTTDNMIVQQVNLGVEGQSAP